MPPRRYIVLFILVAVIPAFIISTWAIQRVGNRQAWLTKTTAQLGVLYSAVITARAEFEDPPHHILTLFWANYLSPGHLLTHMSETTLSGARPGEKSISELTALEWPEFVAYVRPLVEASGEWQRTGDFFVSEHIWTLNLPDQHFVVAFSVKCQFDSDLRVLLYNDGRREVVEGNSWIASENQRRTNAGFPPMPPQIADLANHD